MSDQDTKDTLEQDEPGQNDSVSEGQGGTADADKNKQEEKKFTQAELNEIVKRAKRDAENAAKTKWDKTLEGKHIFTEEDLTKLRGDWETDYKTQSAIAIKRAEFKGKGLTDEQLDVIPGDSADDYAKNAERLFGSLLKKQAPVINSGSNQKHDVSENEDTDAWLKRNIKRRKNW